MKFHLLFPPLTYVPLLLIRDLNLSLFCFREDIRDLQQKAGDCGGWGLAASQLLPPTEQRLGSFGMVLEAHTWSLVLGAKVAPLQ